MTAGTEPPDQDSAFPDQVKTIALAVSKLSGRPHPDPAMLEEIRSETEQLLVNPSATKPYDRLGLMIDQVIAMLRRL